MLLNVPELLRALGLARNQQQELQKVLGKLERSGEIARIKGNRYIRPLDADMVPGRIRINRQGKGFLQADDPKLPTITVPEHATSTAFNGDRVLVRRDVVPHGRRQDGYIQRVPNAAFRSRLRRDLAQLAGAHRRACPGQYGY